MSLTNLSTLQFNYNLTGLQDITTIDGNVLPVNGGSNINVVNDTTQYIVNLDDNIVIDTIQAGTGSFSSILSTNFTGANIYAQTGAINKLLTNEIQFNTSYTPSTTQEGLLYWDSEDKHKTLNLVMANGVEQEVGQEIFYRIKASTTITKGQVVQFNGTQGASNAILGKPAYGLTVEQGSYIMGIAAENIATNDWGYVTSFGIITQLDTRGQNGETWIDGTILYYNNAVTGALTQYIPTGPNTKVQMAAVINSSSNGSLFVRTTFNPSLNQINNVKTSSEATNDLLIYDTDVWVNRDRNTALNNISLTGATIYSLTGTYIAYTGASLGYLAVTSKTPLNLAISQTDSSAGNSFNGYVNFNEKTYMYGNMAASYIANHVYPTNAMLYSINYDTTISCYPNTNSRIYFRPKGYLDSTNQSYFNTSGILIGQGINVGDVTTNTLSASTANLTEANVTNGIVISGRRSGTSSSINQTDVTGINNYYGGSNFYNSVYLTGLNKVLSANSTIGVEFLGSMYCASGSFDKLYAATGGIDYLTATNLTSSNAVITGGRITATTGTFTHLTTTNLTTTNFTGTNGTITNFNSSNATITNGTITASTITATTNLYAPTRLLGKHGVADSFWIGMTGSSSDAERVAIGIEALTDGTGKIQNIKFRTTNAQRMYINSSGQVGIACEPLNRILDVNGTTRIGFAGTSNFLIDLGCAGVGTDRSGYIYGNANEMTILNQQNGPLILGTNNGTRARITANGDFQLGDGTAVYKQIMAGGGNQWGSIGGNFPVFGDGVKFAYNFDISNNYRRVAFAAAYMTVNYGQIQFNCDYATTGAVAQRMVIDGLYGNVGINTTSPACKLQIDSTLNASYNLAGQGAQSNIICRDTGNLAYNGGAITFGASQGNFAYIKGGITDGAGNTAGRLHFGTRQNPSTTDMSVRMTLSQGLYLGDIGDTTNYRLECMNINNTAYYPNSVLTADADTNFAVAATNGSRANTTDSIVGQLGLIYKASPVATTYMSAGMRFYRGAGANDSYFTMSTNSNTERYKCNNSGEHYWASYSNSVNTVSQTFNMRQQSYTNGVGSGIAYSCGDGALVARALINYAAVIYAFGVTNVIQGTAGSNTNHSAWQNATDAVTCDRSGVYELIFNINMEAAANTQVVIYVEKNGAATDQYNHFITGVTNTHCNGVALLEVTRGDVIRMTILPGTVNVQVNANGSKAWLKYVG
jgi:hypothetical protein